MFALGADRTSFNMTEFTIIHTPLPPLPPPPSKNLLKGIKGTACTPTAWKKEKISNFYHVSLRNISQLEVFLGNFNTSII